MFIFNKYKNNAILNNNYYINLDSNSSKIEYSVKYIFNYKSKLIKNFLYFYSIFLVISPFSAYQLKNNIEFRININPNSTIFLDESYENFFLLYNN